MNTKLSNYKFYILTEKHYVKLNWKKKLLETLEIIKRNSKSKFNQVLPKSQYTEQEIIEIVNMIQSLNKLEFNNLFLNIVVSENLENWLEIFEWMYQLANPSEKNDIDLTYVNGTIIIANSNHKPIYKVNFIDIVPVSLGDLYFSESENGSEDITASIVFEYEQYNIQKIIEE